MQVHGRLARNTIGFHRVNCVRGGSANTSDSWRYRHSIVGGIVCGLHRHAQVAGWRRRTGGHAADARVSLPLCVSAFTADTAQTGRAIQRRLSAPSLSDPAHAGRRVVRASSQPGRVVLASHQRVHRLAERLPLRNRNAQDNAHA